MTKPVSTLTTFAGQSGPIPLNQLDTNLSNLASTANDTLTYENYVLDTGAANAYVVTFPAGITVAYQAGLRIVFKAGAANTTASNINVNTLGAQLIVNKDGSALVANQIVAGGLATIIYNGTNFELMTPNDSVAYGAITAPAFIPNGSTVPVNGLYLPSANTLGFATNSTRAVTIDASQNVGIGTTSPSLYGSNFVVHAGTDSNFIVKTIAGTGGGAISGIGIDSLNDAAGGVDNMAFRAATYAWRNASSEIMRLDGSGNLSIGATSVTSAERLNVTGSNANPIARLVNSNASPSGIAVNYTGASPNGTGNEFVACIDSGSTVRATLRSNGGLANFSANNVNLSDERIKKDISLAGPYLDKICAIPVKTFLYKDQTDADLNLGVIAQDVQAVAPELVDTSGFGETPADGVPLLTIYQTDLQYALMKAIQELKAQNDTLTARLAALEAK